MSPQAAKELKSCPSCGYTKEDDDLNLDHHLCKNKNPPWKRCMVRSYHNYEECIDPNSGGFIRCRDCGHSIDCEGED
jgi:hypothetical protein